jgi:hypothetical protein
VQPVDSLVNPHYCPECVYEIKQIKSVVSECLSKLSPIGFKGLALALECLSISALPIKRSHSSRTLNFLLFDGIKTSQDNSDRPKNLYFLYPERRVFREAPISGKKVFGTWEHYVDFHSSKPSESLKGYGFDVCSLQRRSRAQNPAGYFWTKKP